MAADLHGHRRPGAEADIERSDRDKDEFLAMLGHELRYPSSSIVMAMSLMDEAGDASSARERRIVARQVSQLARWLDDLLDIARLQRGTD